MEWSAVWRHWLFPMPARCFTHCGDVYFYSGCTSWQVDATPKTPCSSLMYATDMPRPPACAKKVSPVSAIHSPDGSRARRAETSGVIVDTCLGLKLRTPMTLAKSVARATREV